ncbi:MAG TPA: TfoX/Sxy family protein [Polyangiaceae bacterium]|nr:TfoX/Sxy family protein [Polyangiaceae bacterium]
MKLVKPSPGLIAEFKAMVPLLPLGEPRKMFGYDAVFVNGNMAVGLWQNTCVVKVSPADQAVLLERGHAVPFAPMKDRIMTGWLELSEELAHDPEELLEWSRRAVTYVTTLPRKVKKPSKKSAAKKPSQRRKQASVKPAPKPKASAKPAPTKKPRARTAPRRT